MRRLVLICALLCMPGMPATAAEPEKGAVYVAESQTFVEVVSVDQAARSVVVRDSRGAKATISVPPEAQNLNRVKPGDRFTVRYLEAVAVSVQKGGKASASEVQTVQLAPKGGTPGGKVVNTKQITAVVSQIDRPGRTLTVRGAQDEDITLKVPDTVRSYDAIGVGDAIVLTYTEALALEMIATPSGQSPESTR
jgi:hypothetical protein